MKQLLPLLCDPKYVGFCPICWDLVAKEGAIYPKQCPRCGAPTLAENQDLHTIELGRLELYTMLPFGENWLLLDRVAVDVPVTPSIYTATGHFTVTRAHCEGHFKTEPIFPGAFMIEAANQTFAALMLVIRRHLGFKDLIDPMASAMGMIVKADGVRFKRMVVPGDLVMLDVTTTRIPSAKRRQGYIGFSAIGKVGGEDAYSADHLCLIDRGQDEPFKGAPVQAPEPYSIPSPESAGVD